MPDVPRLLRNTVSFHRLSAAEIDLVAGYSEMHFVETGAAIYREGEASSRLYVVVDGEVEAHRGDAGGPFTVARYVAGESFGDRELWSGATRETGATATRRTTLLVFPRRDLDLEELERRHPELFVAILWESIAEVAGRIRSTNALISTKTPWIRALEGLLFTDALTGLPNRRWLDERLRSLAPDTPASLLVFKPDRFKSVNDRFGHDEGDRVLKLVAAELRRLVRLPAAAARFGGDEFAVLAPGLSRSEGEALAGELLRALAFFAVAPVGGEPLTLEFRVGGASWPCGAGAQPGLAERAGRNVLRARAARLDYVDG